MLSPSSLLKQHCIELLSMYTYLVIHDPFSALRGGKGTKGKHGYVVDAVTVTALRFGICYFYFIYLFL